MAFLLIIPALSLSATRVVVVGAGVAGLCCANHLARVGNDVTLVERADRVGGRVASDVHEGFILDRGFQVFITAYPEAQRMLDYDALDLHEFLPGALVRCLGGFHLVADPFRRPQDLLRGVVAPVGSIVDKGLIALFSLLQRLQTFDAVLAKPEVSTYEYLRSLGMGDVIIDRFFRPFYQGIFLGALEEQSSRLFEYVFRCFTVGVAALPSRGLGEVAAQLARALPDDSIMLNSEVVRVTDTGVVVRGVTGTTERELPAEAVVIAVDRPSLHGLAGISLGDQGIEGGRASTAVYYALDGPPPVKAPLLLLNGETGTVVDDKVVNNVCFPNAVAPSYAPAGKSLASVTLVGCPSLDDEALDAVVRPQLGAWFGAADVAKWQFLKSYKIPYAQPTQQAERFPTPFRHRIHRGLYACGDHTSTPTLNGAMLSGRYAAEALMEDFPAENGARSGGP